MNLELDTVIFDVIRHIVLVIATRNSQVCFLRILSFFVYYYL